MDDYTVQPAATYDRGDTVWLYFEAMGFESRGTSGNTEVWLKFDRLKVYGPDDILLLNLTDIAEAHSTDLPRAPLRSWFNADLTTDTNLEPGQYEFEFTVSCQLSGATGKGSAIFTLK
jgi:hypothetical protein